VQITRGPDIDRFLASPPPACRAAVIHGRDGGLVRERSQRLAQAATARPDDPFDAAHLSEADILADGARLEGELMAVSMMGGRRLVRLRLEGAAGADRIAAAALERHLAGELNPEAFFIIEAGPLRADAALVKLGKTAATCAVIPCYEDEPGDLARLAREALAHEGLTLTAEAAQAFAARLPHDRGVVRQEIERLVLYTGPGSGRQVGLEDLAAFFGVEPDASLGEAAIHAFGGRLGAAQAELRLAAQEGETGVAAARALAFHLGRLRRLATLTLGGVAASAAARSIGVFFKAEREVVRQSHVWTLERLEGPQARILDCERACKRTGAPQRLLVERLAVTIADQARRLGL
jgi:DNA polymerase-3 subunit delta